MLGDDFLKTIPIRKFEADIINDRSLSLADKAFLLDSLQRSAANKRYGAISAGDLIRGMMQAGLYSGAAYAAGKLINKIYSLPAPVTNSIINMAGLGGFLKGIGVMTLNKEGMEKEAQIKWLMNLPLTASRWLGTKTWSVVTSPFTVPKLFLGGLTLLLGLLSLRKLYKGSASMKDVELWAKLERARDILRGLEVEKRKKQKKSLPEKLKLLEKLKED